MSSSLWFLSALIFTLAFTGVSSNTCKGAKSLSTSSGVWCEGSIDAGDSLTASISCLADEIASTTNTCPDDNCVELNIGWTNPDPDQSSTNEIYSFSTCYVAGETIDIKVCGHEDETMASTTEAEASTDSGIDDDHDVCYIGQVKLPPTCTESGIEVELTEDTNEDGVADDNEAVHEFTVQFLTCCDTEGVCKPKPTVDDEYTCISGDKEGEGCPASSDGCWSKVIIKDQQETYLRGCFSDVDVEIEGVKSCTEELRDGKCFTGNDDVEDCYRCCDDKDNCNTWKTKNDINSVTSVKETTTADSVTTTPSFLLLALCFTRALIQFL